MSLIQRFLEIFPAKRFFLLAGIILLIAAAAGSASARNDKRDKTMSKAAKEMSRAVAVIPCGIELIEWDGSYFVFTMDYDPENIVFKGTGDEGREFVREAYIEPFLTDLCKSDLARMLSSLNAGIRIVMPLDSGKSAEKLEYTFEASDFRDLMEH